MFCLNISKLTVKYSIKAYNKKMIIYIIDNIQKKIQNNVYLCDGEHTQTI